MFVLGLFFPAQTITSIPSNGSCSPQQGFDPEVGDQCTIHRFHSVFILLVNSEVSGLSNKLFPGRYFRCTGVQTSIPNRAMSYTGQIKPKLTPKDKTSMGSIITWGAHDPGIWPHSLNTLEITQKRLILHNVVRMYLRQIHT